MKATYWLKMALSGFFLWTLASVSFAEAINLDMHQADSGNFYVHAIIDNDIETDLLLDTGSGYVSLSRSTFSRIKETGSPKFSRHIYGSMANGNIEKVPLYLIDELKLAENCVLKNIEAAVFQKADRDILGLNALSLLQPFTMQLTPATLSSAGCAT